MAELERAAPAHPVELALARLLLVVGFDLVLALLLLPWNAGAPLVQVAQARVVQVRADVRDGRGHFWLEYAGRYTRAAAGGPVLLADGRVAGVCLCSAGEKPVMRSPIIPVISALNRHVQSSPCRAIAPTRILPHNDGSDTLIVTGMPPGAMMRMNMRPQSPVRYHPTAVGGPGQAGMFEERDQLRP